MRHSILITRVAITVVPGGLAAIHVLWPDLAIDAVTLAFIVLAVAPWLAPVIKSLELPGGFRIELHEVQHATRKVIEESEAAGAIEGRGPAPEFPSPPPLQSSLEDRLERIRSIADSDPGLALVSLRIEIEQMLRAMARSSHIDTSRGGVRNILRELEKETILPAPLASGLADLIGLGNQAAHGAPVTREAADWAVRSAPVILEALTAYLGD